MIVSTDSFKHCNVNSHVQHPYHFFTPQGVSISSDMHLINTSLKTCLLEQGGWRWVELKPHLLTRFDRVSAALCCLDCWMAYSSIQGFDGYDWLDSPSCAQDDMTWMPGLEVANLHASRCCSPVYQICITNIAELTAISSHQNAKLPLKGICVYLCCSLITLEYGRIQSAGDTLSSMRYNILI